jgi:hypothetical protein
LTRRFEFRYALFRGSAFPIIPLQLRTSSGEWIATTALLDSGASISLFDAAIGKGLGIRIDDGRRVTPTGIGGPVVAYVHRIVIRIGDKELETQIAFTKRRKLPVNLLGRADVFDGFLVTFDEKRRVTVLETE